MTRIAALMAYLFFYSFYYGIPILIMNTIAEKFKNNIVTVILYIPMLILSVMILYRTKLAAEAYGNADIKFMEAHRTSWETMKVQLSFLPIIGCIFKNDSGDKKSNTKEDK